MLFVTDCKKQNVQYSFDIDLKRFNKDICYWFVQVTLNMEAVNFLGISIVGQSNKGGDDGGIYVGSIMKGGAVALDGRIEPGDMILQVKIVIIYFLIKNNFY